MSTQYQYRTLSRRGSKLLVELVIGVIGILGIFVAQNGGYHSEQLKQPVGSQVSTLANSTSSTSGKVDWLDILF